MSKSHFSDIQNQYNSLYASKEVIFGDGKPIESVVKLNKHLDGGTVLDIGGGEGRNALYLAKQGFEVSVSDLSKVGIEKINSAAKEGGLNIDTHVTDTITEGIDRTYNSIVISFMLHHVLECDAEKLIAETQKHTYKNGVHVVATFMNTGDLYERNKTSGRFYPSEEQIKELYASWNIKDFSTYETTTHARNKDGERMKNHVMELIAVKSE